MCARTLEKKVTVQSPFSPNRILKLSVPGIAVAVAMLMGILGSSPPEAYSQTKFADWSPGPCMYKAAKNGAPPNVECGYLSVPLRHAEPIGQKIKLAVAIVRYKGADKNPDPVFYAQGGPGGTTLETYAGFVLLNKTAERYKRDLVLWDQRGTLHSQPNLLCSEVNDVQLKEAIEDPSIETEKKLEIAAFQACADRLKKNGVVLPPFNSVENAHDIDAIRQAFGYSKINFYGVSYGTLLGQHLLREHGEAVRSMVLDGVVPTTVNFIEDAVHSKQRIGEKYFLGCAQDPVCGEAFPDLAKRYLNLLDRLDAQPVSVTVQDSETAKSYTVKLTGTLLEDMLYQALYGASLHRLVPYMVDQVTKGDYGLVQSLMGMFLFDNDMSLGMYQTVMCGERGNTDISKFDHLSLLPRLVKEERSDAESFVETCKNWNIPLLPGQVREAVKSDVPAVLFSGDFDPITPPPYAEIVEKTLSNHYNFVFPNGSHGQLSSNPCAEAVMQDFFSDPTKRPNPDCLGRLALKPYYTKSDFVHLPLLAGGMPAGLAGVVMAAARLSGVAVPSIILFLSGFLYALAYLFSRIRGSRPQVEPVAPWAHVFSKLAPWFAVFAGASGLIFLVILVASIVSSLGENYFFLLLGVISSQHFWVLRMPLIIAFAIVLMIISCIAVWTSKQRSVFGRIAYSILTLLGVACVKSLSAAGFFSYWSF